MKNVLAKLDETWTKMDVRERSLFLNKVIGVELMIVLMELIALIGENM